MIEPRADSARRQTHDRTDALHFRRRREEFATIAHLSYTDPMPESPTPIRIVLTTADNPRDAARLGRTLVEERLAACISMIPAVQSIYRWKEQIESSTETLMLIKTGSAQLTALETRLHELHSYETPEFLVLDVDAASHPYLDWLQSCLHLPS